MSDAERTARYRHRRKRGVRCYDAEVLYPEFVEELIEAKILTDEDSRDASIISARISEVLEAWRQHHRAERLR